MLYKLMRALVVCAAALAILASTAVPSQASDDWHQVTSKKFTKRCNHDKHHDGSFAAVTKRAVATGNACGNGKNDWMIRFCVSDRKKDGLGAVAEIRYQAYVSLGRLGSHWMWHKRHIVIDRNGKSDKPKCSRYYDSSFPTRKIRLRVETVNRHGHFHHAGRWHKGKFI